MRWVTLVTSNDWKSFMDWNSNAKAPKKTCCTVAFTIPMASTTWRILKAFNWAGLIEGRRSIFRPLNGIIPRQGLVSFIVLISFTTCWHFLQLSFMARLGEGRFVGLHHVANCKLRKRIPRACGTTQSYFCACCCTSPRCSFLLSSLYSLSLDIDD